MRPPGPTWILTLCSALNALAHAQSTCTFMRQTPYDLSHMPEEPEIVTNFTQCRANGQHTCCTASMEPDMERFARQRIDQFVQSHVVTFRQTLDGFANQFRAHFRDALRSTERQLDQMFDATYGPFYRQHSKIFGDFFDEIDEQFAVDELSASPRPALGSLFRKIFLTEFSLMNPMRDISDAERHCMARLQSNLKPFGHLPAKIALQLERAFHSWKTVTTALEKASILLIGIGDKMVLQRRCIDELTNMRQCHVCVGASPETKPCLGYCLNVLRGCFGELAEVEPQWTGFIEALQKLSTRLKSASNPFATLAPLPVQLSEAIMLFQERGEHISNRIVLQCFQPKFRLKRGVREMEEPIQERPIVLRTGTDDGPSKWLSDSLAEQYAKANAVRHQMADFNDRVARMKGAWRLLPTAICSDGQLAASQGEQCWNGNAVSNYRRPLAGVGVAMLRRNVEFAAGTMNLSKETFIDERLKLQSLTNQLNAVFEGRSISSADAHPEGSALQELNPSKNPDDEDEFEGSAYNCGEHLDVDPQDVVKIHLLEQRGLKSSAAIVASPSSRTIYCLISLLFLLLRI